MPALRPTLTLEERTARHKLLARDTVALSSLLSIAIALTFMTYLLFHSFASHRLKLEMRWKARGEAALADHQPMLAIDSLRSALAYSPDDRGLQIELATALAAAGRTQEAMVYFTTLHEAEPGNGMINVQLARLFATQGNVALAITQYQAALDGTWNGDGFLRRREVRLELSRYLIAQHRFDEARNQLLIAAGNAADNHGLQLSVAGLLEQADGDADAYNLYRKAMAYNDTRTSGMVGAGRTAAAQSRYLLARNLLQQAIAQPDFGRLPEDERAAVRSVLQQAVEVLDAFPAASLPLHVRAVRAAHAAQLARSRLLACSTTAPVAVVGPAGETKPTVGSSPRAGSRVKAIADSTASSSLSPAATNQASPHTVGALSSAISAVQRARNSLAQRAQSPLLSQATMSQATLAFSSLAARWQQLPPVGALELRMERDPALLESTLQLIYETEQQTQQSAESDPQSAEKPSTCTPPTKEDILLLKMAAAPDEIERQ